MPFRIEDFNFKEWLDPEGSGVPVLTDAEVAEAIRESVLVVMTEYNTRLNRIVGAWKPYNKPRFAPNVSVERQLGLHSIESNPIEFHLENDSIFHLVSVGVNRTYPIRARADGPGYLAFIGWEGKTAGESTTREKRRIRRNRAGFESRRVEKVGTTKRRARGAAGVFYDGPRDLTQLGRFNQAEAVRAKGKVSQSFPPTWLPASKPGSFSSRKPAYLGNTVVGVRPAKGNFDTVLVHHPGFTGRGFEEELASPTSSLSRVGNLDDYYLDQVTARLERAAGRRLTGGIAPQIRGAKRPFFLEGGKKNFAVKSFIKNYNEKQGL